VLVVGVGVVGMRDNKRKCMRDGLVFRDVVDLERNAVDAFVEDGEGVEYVGVDEVLHDFAGLH